ncbi:MAG: hypothetical protein AAFZ52_18030, partial [Bacteroidota bacterium]
LVIIQNKEKPYRPVLGLFLNPNLPDLSYPLVGTSSASPSGIQCPFNRNEFIDMANVVVFTDSSLLVYSAAQPRMELRYPLRDSIVHGAEDPAYHWPVRQIGVDSLVLTDSVKKNRYYLQRLRRSDVPELREWLTAGELYRQSEERSGHLLLEGNGEQASCYAARSYRRIRDWRKIIAARQAGIEEKNLPKTYRSPPLRQEEKDGYWRLDERFAQPLWTYSTDENLHYLVMVDSLAGDSLLFGKRVSTHVPNQVYSLQWQRAQEHNPASFKTEITMAESPIYLWQPDSIRHSYYRSSFTGKELQNGLVIPDFELSQLRLQIDTTGFYDLRTPERSLAQGEYQVHERGNYLVVNEGCVNLDYWPYTISDTALVLRIPLKVEITEFPEGEYTRRRYFLDEWSVYFSLRAK